MNKQLKKSLLRALVVNVVVLLLASTILDHGATAKAFIVSMVAFWAGALVITIRTKDQMSSVSIYYLKYGLVVLFFLSAIIGPAIWRYDYRAMAKPNHTIKADEMTGGDSR